jgi:hypothetical protein
VLFFKKVIMFQLILNGADNRILYLGLLENLGDMEHEPILQMGTDRMILRHAHHKPFTVKFPDKCEWQNRFKPDIRKGLAWYTDGSKTNKGTGTGVSEGAQERGIASALGSTPQYSKLKYTPLRRV